MTLEHPESMPADAVALLAQQIARHLGQPTAPKPWPSCADVAPAYERWFVLERPRSAKSMGCMLRTVLRHPLGSKPIDQLTWMDLDDYKARRIGSPSKHTKRPISPASVDAEICTLLMMLNWACAQGRRAATGVLYNPIAGYELRSQKDRSLRRTKVYTHAEDRDILRYCRNPYLKAMILAVGNFIREAELLRVERSQLSELANENGSTTWVLHLRGDQTKNGRPREIPLFDETIAAFKALPSWKAGGPWLMQNIRTGRPYSRAHIAKRFAALREQIGLKGSDGRPAHLYSHRHTSATRAINGGLNIAAVAEMMGHGDWKMLQQRYAQLELRTKTTTIHELQAMRTSGQAALPTRGGRRGS